MLSTTEIDRLAAMANAVRPDWPIRSLRTGIATNHRARAYQDVAVAMAWIATDPATRTPGRLDEAGPWWDAAQAGSSGQEHGRSDPRSPRCQVVGHGSYPVRNCGACRFESLDPSDPTPEPGPSRYAEAAARGAQACREAIGAGRRAAARTDERKG
ncbi:MAG: hypothetical protein FWD18_00410 [Micrococcales bacterium]|nr:hypothetical protein [Micrococcales bacterium]